MSGTVRDEKGLDHPISFDVTATARGGGHFDLKGIVFAPPWAPEVEALGTFTIAPLKRSITYHLRFTTKAGDTLTLDGVKRPSVFVPVRSMTVMPATLREPGGGVIARGTMSFDLRDLLSFLASWMPGLKRQQKRLDVRRRAVARQALHG